MTGHGFRDSGRDRRETGDSLGQAQGLLSELSSSAVATAAQLCKFLNPRALLSYDRLFRHIEYTSKKMLQTNSFNL